MTYMLQLQIQYVYCHASIIPDTIWIGYSYQCKFSMDIQNLDIE
jgi:hypothetical protein